MIVAYTVEYERLISSWPSTPTVGTWIDFCYRGNHVYDRVVKDTAMTLPSIAKVGWTSLCWARPGGAGASCTRSR